VNGATLIRGILRRNARRLVPGTLLLSLHQLCEAAVPLVIGLAVDRAVATGSVPAIVLWVGVLAGLFLILTTAYRQGARLVTTAIAHEGHHLRVALSRTLLDPRGVRTEHETGALLSISSSDVDSAADVGDHVPVVIAALVTTVGCGVVLLTIDVPLGLIVLIGVPLVVACLQWTAPIIATRVEAQQDRIGRATALAADLIRGLRPLQGIGAQAAATQRYRTANRQALEATLSAARAESVHTGASSAAGALAAVTVAVVATYFAMGGSLTIGALITVIGLAQFLMEPFGVLALAPSWVADARGAATRIAAVLDAPYRTPDPTRPVTVSGGALSVKITGPRTLSFTVASGEFVALLAADARDAAALADVLSQPVEGIAPAERWSTLLVERHGADLFSGTVASNLALSGADDATQALQASRADEVVALHADGTDYAIVERGANLSGGQRQRLALARALAADPAVLVLHDPTTAVDAVTEQAIADGIRRLRQQRTTLVITSSPALLAVADRVLHVVDGAVAAEGDHAHLLDSDPNYAAAVTR
jgi:putative ABC transport system ATP-binding protein